MLSTNWSTLCANTKTRKLASKSSLTGTFTMLESKPLLFSNKCYLSMQQRKGYSFFLRSFKWLLSKAYIKNLSIERRKKYVILKVGHRKWLRPLTRWVGGLKKGQKRAYVIFEWSLSIIIYHHNLQSGSHL